VIEADIYIIFSDILFTGVLIQIDCLRGWL